MSVELLLSAGLPPTSTVGDPGTHGAGITGMQGMGVSAPIAAAVAEATVGFAMELHMPNGMMFTIGTLSLMVATGIVDCTIEVGSTLSVEGAAPNGHWSIAPEHTHIPMMFLTSR